jgi:hypothetical protein
MSEEDTMSKRRMAVLFLGVLVAAIVGTFVGTNTHVYGGRYNAGVEFAYVGGFEVKGEPGFYWCDDQC